LYHLIFLVKIKFIMKVCIIGNNLTSLALAKALVNIEIFVDIFYTRKKLNYNKTRTIGLSKSNIDYFNRHIIDIKKIIWPIKEIKIFSENSGNKEIIKFEDQNSNLFSIMQNQKIYSQLISELNKSRFFKFKKYTTLNNLNKFEHDLIINCDYNHEITKKFFSKKFEKKYDSTALTTIINHKKLKSNNFATQVFTNQGPLAFLPMSNQKTSIVYSLRKGNKNIDIKKIISKFNFNYKIKKINEISKFKLKSLNLRNYYRGNILAFGDLLHKLHPLAGQGFNMSIRDIKNLLEIIDNKIKVGLPLDQSVCSEFEKKVRSENFIFSEGIDFIYECFNSENKVKNNFIDTTVKFIGKNKTINKYFKKFADTGLQI